MLAPTRLPGRGGAGRRLRSMLVLFLISELRMLALRMWRACCRGRTRMPRAAGDSGSHDAPAQRSAVLRGRDRFLASRRGSPARPDRWRGHGGSRRPCARQWLSLSSRMMFSSAVMISSFSTRDFLKLRRMSNAFVGGRKLKTKNFGRPGFGLAVSFRAS